MRAHQSESTTNFLSLWIGGYGSVLSGAGSVLLEVAIVDVGSMVNGLDGFYWFEGLLRLLKVKIRRSRRGSSAKRPVRLHGVAMQWVAPQIIAAACAVRSLVGI